MKPFLLTATEVLLMLTFALFRVILITTRISHALITPLDAEIRRIKNYTKFPYFEEQDGI